MTATAAGASCRSGQGTIDTEGAGQCALQYPSRAPGGPAAASDAEPSVETRLAVRYVSPTTRYLQPLGGRTTLPVTPSSSRPISSRMWRPSPQLTASSAPAAESERGTRKRVSPVGVILPDLGGVPQYANGTTTGRGARTPGPACWNGPSVLGPCEPGKRRAISGVTGSPDCHRPGLSPRRACG